MKTIAITAACGLVSLAAILTVKATEEKVGVTKAVCVVRPLSGSHVEGVVTFTVRDGVVEVDADIKGLTPGMHGFHIHEFGDCTMDDGTCAGGHFNPTGMPHGGPKDEKRHVGDLGNLEAGKDGTATLKMSDKFLQLTGDHSILGRAIIIHDKADDLKTQPSGDAGKRVGCGVIGIAKPD